MQMLSWGVAVWAEEMSRLMGSQEWPLVVVGVLGGGKMEC